MKHLSQIQSEFIKTAKWEDLSYEKQKTYLKRHPKSRKKITSKPLNSNKTIESFEVSVPATDRALVEKFLKDNGIYYDVGISGNGYMFDIENLDDKDEILNDLRKKGVRFR